jgi:hypothetical protein
VVNDLAYSRTGSWYVPKFDRVARLLTFVIKQEDPCEGDFHVRFGENLRVQLPWVTRL